ncbi:MAG: hypothetical protein F6K48_12935 [Okeania sp. SIO3H1]|uniref:hypothetical protein n=1 Tax=Okeania sp. SIO1I7 TaxID=2607772 RepID=UPI0013CBA477|nr:hypothetical protein [Okeania sp. SIO1I7]NEN89760.1 hypothetical protein [Okeania sp. SIO3H1]NET27388.1 hypothetical protein [Okeania sp. SIO1I7]
MGKPEDASLLKDGEAISTETIGCFVEIIKAQTSGSTCGFEVVGLTKSAASS